MEHHTDGIKPCRNSVTGFAFVPAAAAGFAFQPCFLLSKPPVGSRWQHRQRLQSRRKGLAWKGSDSNEFVLSVPGWKLWWKHSWNFKLWSFFLEFASWILFLESSVAAFISQKFSHQKAIVTELKRAKPYDKGIVKCSHVSQKTNGFKAIYQRSFGLNQSLIFSATSSHFTARYKTSALCRNTGLAGDPWVLKSSHLQFQVQRHICLFNVKSIGPAPPQNSPNSWVTKTKEHWTSTAGTWQAQLYAPTKCLNRVQIGGG